MNNQDEDTRPRSPVSHERSQCIRVNPAGIESRVLCDGKGKELCNGKKSILGVSERREEYDV